MVVMLGAGRAVALVDDLQITEHVRHSELIIVATIRERGADSVELDVVEVLKGTRLARLTVDLSPSFACDMSSAVPKRGRGLFFLNRKDGHWLIAHFGRGFIEHEPDSDIGTMTGGVIFPRAWLAPGGQRTRIRWSVMLDEVRRLIAGRRVFPDAGWTMEHVDCSRCELEQSVTQLRDAGVFDWGRLMELPARRGCATGCRAAANGGERRWAFSRPSPSVDLREPAASSSSGAMAARPSRSRRRSRPDSSPCVGTPGSRRSRALRCRPSAAGGCGVSVRRGSPSAPRPRRSRASRWRTRHACAARAIAAVSMAKAGRSETSGAAVSVVHRSAESGVRSLTAVRRWTK